MDTNMKRLRASHTAWTLRAKKPFLQKKVRGIPTSDFRGHLIWTNKPSMAPTTPRKNAHSQGTFGRTLLQGISRRVEFDGEGFYDSIADVLGNIVKRSCRDSHVYFKIKVRPSCKPSDGHRDTQLWGDVTPQRAQPARSFGRCEVEGRPRDTQTSAGPCGTCV